MSLTALPLVSKFPSHIIRILGCNPGVMTLQGTNTYLLGTGQRRILIDSGDEETAPEYTKLLKSVLDKEKATIEHLIITHWHHDHIGGVKAVKELIKSISASLPTVWKLRRSFEDVNNESGCGEDWQALNDEQFIEVDGAKLQVKHTPGHTTDHACLVLQQNNSLFSGDCILGETTAVFEDLSDYMNSLKKILDSSPKIIYPGHGPVIDNPLPKIKYYIDHRNKRELQIVDFLNQNRDKWLSNMDIVAHLYKDTPKTLWPAAEINVFHHLQKLLKENRVRTKDGDWQLVTIDHKL
ncbi:beta-lactamase-like protein 2 homolog [Microplitis mediator]|uniref:beta-lactamase-like protein 2 homolog n=1 Tax=Microplitis mediator TaxID=375433 RepID=UPI002555D609|nr:beta-lactamase-like protein 2 homolog [Microplitis mediator]